MLRVRDWRLYRIDEVKRLSRQLHEFAFEAGFQRGRAEKAEHRAEVAERALLEMCRAYAPIPSYMLATAEMERMSEQAEKQLAEEKEK